MRRNFAFFLNRFIPAYLQRAVEIRRFEKEAKRLLPTLWRLRDHAAAMDARFDLNEVINDVHHVDWNSVMFNRVRSEDFLDSFVRAKARALYHGVDVETIIQKNGGEPDFEPYDIRATLSLSTLLRVHHSRAERKLDIRKQKVKRLFRPPTQG